MNKGKASVAIVIVNWNKQSEVLTLLSSLKRFNYDRHDIILVDNASSDDSVSLVRSRYPDVHLLVNSVNLGGSGGFNTGLRYVQDSGRYRYVWLLDNDAEVMEGALEALLDVAESDEQVAIVGSKILHADDSTIISEVGARISRLTSFPIPMLFNQPDNGNLVEFEVDYVAACSLLARVEHVREVGIMEEGFFLMWDDMEWGMRFRAAGYRVVATTASAVIHRGFSERLVTTDYRYYAARNHLYFASKAYSGMKLVYYLLVLSIVYSIRARIYLLRESTKPYAFAITQGIHDYWNRSMGKNTSGASTNATSTANPHISVGDFGHILLSTERPMPLVRGLVSDYKAKYPRMRITLAVRPIRGSLFRWHQGEFAYCNKEVFLGKHEKADVFVRFFDEVARPFHYDSKMLIDIDNNAAITRVTHINIAMGYGIWLKYSAAFLHGILGGVVSMLGGVLFRPSSVTKLY